MLDSPAQASINCCHSVLHVPIYHDPLPDASMRVCVTTRWPRSSVKPSSLSTHPTPPQKPSQIRFTAWPSNHLYSAQCRGLPGLEVRLLGGGRQRCQSLKLALLKKCHLVNRCTKPPVEQPGHSVRMLITRNLKELKAIMTNNKVFLLRRTFGSLRLLAKPSYKFRSQELML